MGPLHTNQCGLVHEEGLVLAAEYGEIVLETVCAAFPRGRRILFAQHLSAAFDTDHAHLIFSVSFANPI